MKSFKIRSGKKILDYRLGENLDLGKIRDYFQKSYKVQKLWQGARHVLGILTKGNQTYFLKLSTSEGISVVTKNEYNWNNCFNKYFPNDFRFRVPKNYDSGLYKKKYFYLITDYFDGKLICDINEDATHLITDIEEIILFSELIQQMPRGEAGDFKQKFTDKVNKWFNDIPVDVRKKFRIDTLLKIMEEGVNELISRPRHGDFAPWHIIKLGDNKLGLIDGEHFLPNGVENYDICYFIQRVFSVLKNPAIAKEIYSQLLKGGYDKDKLKVVLAARAIGGFLDESLASKPDYQFAKSFKDWVIGKSD